MLTILLQLHAATFSALIAEQDSTKSMLEVASCSEFLVFLELLVVYVLQGPPQDLGLSPQFHPSSHSRYLSLHYHVLVLRSTHHNLAPGACKVNKIDQDMIRGSHMQFLASTLIWIQVYGTTSLRDQMIMSHQWRNIILSDAWCTAHLFPINRPRNTQFHKGTDDLVFDSSEIITLIECFSVSLISHSLSFSCTCLCHQIYWFRSTQTFGSTTIQNCISRRNLHL